MVREACFCTLLVRQEIAGCSTGDESCAKSALSLAGCRIIVGTDPAL
jgi:hypothetical protein